MGKKLVVIGDIIQDIWVSGKLEACADNCPRFMATGGPMFSPGGAANAARQLCHSGDEVFLIGPNGSARTSLLHGQINTEFCLHEGIIPVKTRFVAGGRIVFRSDREAHNYGIGPDVMADLMRVALAAIEGIRPDGVLISDYDKGFLSSETIYKIIRWCRNKGVPVVCDPKKTPSAYRGSVLKCNQEYANRHGPLVSADNLAGLVVTAGKGAPWVARERGSVRLVPQPPVGGAKTVGAGDCFAAWLLKGLVDGEELIEAAWLADCAARVYVTGHYGRPSWPHEVLRKMYGSAGKLLCAEQLPALRQSISGSLVFTNGVFRIPHAGHIWLLNWAKKQGDVLVVGINDDESAQALRPDQVILPVSDRKVFLAGLEAVDWIVPFSSATPAEIIRELAPDVLVKGNDYTGKEVAGSDLVADVRIAPPSPVPGHASDIVTLAWRLGK